MKLPNPYVTNHPRRGSAMAILAVSLVLILSVMALALDGSLMMAERRHAQSVADASAYAAAGLLYKNYSTDQGLDPTGSSRRIALAIAAGNGYANDTTTSIVTVNIPPQSGTYVGQSGYAEVIVSYNIPRCFSAIWGSSKLTVGARTVARGYVKKPAATILVLDPNGQGAVTLSGSANVTTDGKVVVDSNNTKAVVGSATMTMTAPEFDITGNKSLSGSAALIGTVKTGTTPMADPLASLTAPSTSGLVVRSNSSMNIGTNQTIYPGVYQGGIQLSGSAAVTMMPGIYYFQGGGLALSGSSSISGAGVLLYNDSSGGKLALSGTGAITLTPMSTGAYAGIAIYQDRNNSQKVDLSGGSASSITGTIYAAGAMLNLSGQSGSFQAGSQLIVKDLTLSGSGSIVVNSGNAPGNNRVLNIVE